MAAIASRSCIAAKTSFVGKNSQLKASKPQAAVSRSVVAVQAADKASWCPGAISPEYLDGSLAGDFGFDPMGLGADPVALKWYRQAELMHARWAMMGVAGILAQEFFVPDVFWYEAALPDNLPDFVNGDFNMGTIFGFQFLMMHYVEVRRWQDYKNFGSVNEDPIFKGNTVPNTEMGYPGGIFDPFGYSKGDGLKELQTKEIKNGRLAMVAFAGFVIQAQAFGVGPLASLQEEPFTFGKCVLPSSVDVSGVTIPTPCLWPTY